MVDRRVVVLLSLITASCSTSAPNAQSDGSVSVASTPLTTAVSEPTTSIADVTTTTISTTTTPTITTPPITAPPSAAAAPTATTATTAACLFDGGVDDVMHDFPFQLSGQVGADIRTGSHGCFERIVIELDPGDFPTDPITPGYWIRYADGPLTLGQSDDQFVELAGDADLLITVNAWMTTFDGDGDLFGYTGPTDITPANVEAIKELRLIDNSEGVHTWAIGLDTTRPFRVSTLDDPTRIVVDVATPAS